MNSSVGSRRSAAAAVSRALRKLGYRPLPADVSRDRQGVIVQAGLLDTMVQARFDSETRSRRTAAEIAKDLTEAGWTVRFTEGSTFVNVQRKGDTS